MFTQALGNLVHDRENLSVVDNGCRVMDVDANVNRLKDFFLWVMKLFDLGKNGLDAVVHNIAMLSTVSAAFCLASEVLAKMVDSIRCICSTLSAIVLDDCTLSPVGIAPSPV